MNQTKIIAIANQKGGVGKTTTAANLGAGLTQLGRRVMQRNPLTNGKAVDSAARKDSTERGLNRLRQRFRVDADSQASLTVSLGVSQPDDLPVTVGNIIQNIMDDTPFDPREGIIHHSEGFDLLPSNILLSGTEVRMVNAMSRERLLSQYLDMVKRDYDYVLIDCTPSLGVLTLNALAAADSVIIPTQQHYLSAKGLELLLQTVSRVCKTINPSLQIDGILMTMVRRKEDGRYELISGHRRCRACALAGLTTLKCEVRELTHDEAVIIMVESNLQRSVILPSEKAFAYKMRLEAMNRQ